MAINRLEYPITTDEAVNVIYELANEIRDENAKTVVFGDVRYENLMWAAHRLECLKRFENDIK